MFQMFRKTNQETPANQTRTVTIMGDVDDDDDGGDGNGDDYHEDVVGYDMTKVCGYLSISYSLLQADVQTRDMVERLNNNLARETNRIFHILLLLLLPPLLFYSFFLLYCCTVLLK